MGARLIKATIGLFLLIAVASATPSPIDPTYPVNQGKHITACILQLAQDIAPVIGFAMLLMGGITYIAAAEDSKQRILGKKFCYMAIVGMVSVVALVQIAALNPFNVPVSLCDATFSALPPTGGTGPGTPTTLASAIPTTLPTGTPTTAPTGTPTTLASAIPTTLPGTTPTTLPSTTPTTIPGTIPTTLPSTTPTTTPGTPTTLPGTTPTTTPGSTPTTLPSTTPTTTPGTPTTLPGTTPTTTPGSTPTTLPSTTPTTIPGTIPTTLPGTTPTTLMPGATTIPGTPTTLPGTTPTTTPGSTPTTTPGSTTPTTVTPSGTATTMPVTPTTLPSTTPTTLPGATPTTITPSGTPTTLPGTTPGSPTTTLPIGGGPVTGTGTVGLPTWNPPIAGTGTNWRNFNGINYVTGVRDQDSTGTCWAHAINSVMEAMWRINFWGRPTTTLRVTTTTQSGPTTTSKPTIRRTTTIPRPTTTIPGQTTTLIVTTTTIPGQTTTTIPGATTTTIPGQTTTTIPGATTTTIPGQTTTIPPVTTTIPGQTTTIPPVTTTIPGQTTTTISTTTTTLTSTTTIPTTTTTLLPTAMDMSERALACKMGKVLDDGDPYNDGATSSEMAQALARIGSECLVSDQCVDSDGSSLTTACPTVDCSQNTVCDPTCRPCTEGCYDLGGYSTFGYSLNKFKSELNNGPITLAMTWRMVSMPGMPTGFMQNTGAVQGGHAVTIVGYVDTNQVPGGGYFIIKNSWGTGWGDGGYCYLPYGSFSASDMWFGQSMTNVNQC